MGSDKEQQVTEIRVAEDVSISDEMSLSLMRWNSIANARTAVLMARHCQQLEQSHQGLAPGTPEYDEAADEHWAFASSSVVASAMFLEANINEVFLSARISLREEQRPGFIGHGFPYVGGLLPRDDRRRLDEAWDLVDNASLLDKYQFVLTLLGKAQLDKGSAPYQPANALVGARNKLVHFKEGVHTVGSDLTHLQSQLRNFAGGASFQPHPFTSPGNRFYPEQFFGYAGCRWAWRTADALAQEFHARLGIDPAYQRNRPALAL